jgi:hypothetical protein
MPRATLTFTLANKEDVLTTNTNQLFLKYQDTFAQSYPLIAFAFENEYGWPEMDTLRHEACLCIAFGLCQSAMTLCNHFMESLLKYSLIYHHSINNEPTILSGTDIVEMMEAYTKKGIEKYGHLTLNSTIDEAHSLGIIEDDEKVMLHNFRQDFRNAYSHADKKKTFGDTTVPVQSARIESDGIVTGIPVNAVIASNPIIHSIAQASKAANDAPYYFLYLDNLVRSMKPRVFRDA